VAFFLNKVSKQEKKNEKRKENNSNTLLKCIADLIPDNRNLY
jgi:hypothetical protein